MAWTATLLRLKKEHGRVEFEISYQDGTDTINKAYSFERFSKTRIRKLARDEVARLEEVRTEVIDLPLDTNIDLTPPPPPPDPPAPTPAQIAKRAWFDDWRKLQTLLVLVDAGILQQNDSRITPLKTTLTADFLNAYLSDIL